MSEPYDSRIDTQAHIDRVATFLNQFAGILQERAIVHDKSKLMSPEKEVFDRVTPQLRGLEYGSDEYKASLAEMGDALKNHYIQNSHHPEHYPNGINDMTLFDIVEMLCDWKAATERHATGNLHKSIEINTERFKMSPQLAEIFVNTIERIGWER